MSLNAAANIATILSSLITTVRGSEGNKSNLTPLKLDGSKMGKSLSYDRSTYGNLAVPTSAIWNYAQRVAR